MNKQLVKDLIITLDSGLKVRVEAFSFTNTYGGVLIGRKDDESLNEDIIESAKSSRDWGARKTFKIKPLQEEVQKGLKPYRFTVWLTSGKPIDPNYCGSELVIIWFEDMPVGSSIVEIIQNGIHAVDWEGNAQDYVP
jgi:hypothetical protein